MVGMAVALELRDVGAVIITFRTFESVFVFMAKHVISQIYMAFKVLVTQVTKVRLTLII